MKVLDIVIYCPCLVPLTVEKMTLGIYMWSCLRPGINLYIYPGYKSVRCNLKTQVSSYKEYLWILHDITQSCNMWDVCIKRIVSVFDTENCRRILYNDGGTWIFVKIINNELNCKTYASYTCRKHAFYKTKVNLHYTLKLPI